MVPPDDSDGYLPCRKCGVWVPVLAAEVHRTECHRHGLATFSHPHVSGSSMYSIIVIAGNTDQSPKPSQKEKTKGAKGKSSVKKEKKNRKVKNDPSGTDMDVSELMATIKPTIEEPEWLKKIYSAFQYRIVLLNERDLIRCGMRAYSPVVVGPEEGEPCAFLAVPDESVRLGHSVLHQHSLKYIPSLKVNTENIWVAKISEVEYIDELILTPSKNLSESECSLYEQQLKHLLYCNFPLGAPFTLKLGSKIFFPSLDNLDCDLTFQVENFRFKSNEMEQKLVLKPEDLVKKMETLNMNSSIPDLSASENSVTIPSGLVTIDEYKSSDDSLRDDFTRLQIADDSTASEHFVTLDEVHDSPVSLYTSTPKRNLDGMDSPRKTLFISSIKDSDTSFAKPETECRDHSCRTKDDTEHNLKKCNSWVRTGERTQVRILQKSETVQGEETVNKREPRRESYCKDQAYSSLIKIMKLKFSEESNTGSPLLAGWGGVLLHGPPGTGKTLMVHQAAEEMQVPVVSLSLADLSRHQGSREDCVQRKVQEAMRCGPSVVFVDEVESVCPAGEHRTRGITDLTPTVLQAIHTLQSSPVPVLLVAASSRPDGISPRLRSSGQLEWEVLVPLPDARQRSRILDQLLAHHRHQLDKGDVAEVAGLAYGFSGADLSVLLRCAWLSCVQRCDSMKGSREGSCEGLCLRKEDLLAGMQGIIPTMLRQDYSAVSLVKWCDIWGYQAIKSKLKEMIERHLNEPERYRLKGLLLYGPPGCSKTMFARALVNETGFSFFPLKCSDLLSKYVGETEKSLSRVFERAMQAAPALLFMDELDSLCGDRGSGGGSDGGGLVADLLSLLSRAESRGNIMVVGATNRPHMVDEALLRPGFLEQVVHVDLPDSESRREIWQGLLHDVPQAGPVSVDRLALETAGYSGAEITAIYQVAAHRVIQGLEASEQPDSHDVTVSEQLLLEAITANPPRTKTSMLEAIARFKQQRQEGIQK